MPRQRKTAEQHRKEGTWQRCRHANRLDEATVKGKPPLPSTLNDDGRELWRGWVDGCDQLSTLDAESLRVYCETWQIYLIVSEVMRANPLDKDTRITWSALVDKLDKLGRQFGWSPKSREVRGPATDGDGEDDPFERYLQQRASKE